MNRFLCLLPYCVFGYGFKIKRGCQQCAGIAFAWGIENLLCVSMFDHATIFHHDNVMG